MTELYQLPISGDWITLASVSSVRSKRAHETAGFNFPDTVGVIVWAGCQKPNARDHYEIICSSAKESDRIRDEIAAAVNAARTDVAES